MREETARLRDQRLHQQAQHRNETTLEETRLRENTALQQARHRNETTLEEARHRNETTLAETRIRENNVLEQETTARERNRLIVEYLRSWPFIFFTLPAFLFALGYLGFGIYGLAAGRGSQV
jgi:hypothetical protein